MRLIMFTILMAAYTSYSQSLNDLKKRFDTYLNFNGSLNALVLFKDDGVAILKQGKPEFTVYADEQSVISQVITNTPPDNFLALYHWKKNKHLSKKQLDSLGGIYSESPISAKNLKGRKIAIDPGHFAGNMEVAKIEQKFIYFIPSSSNGLKDTIQFNEGVLTFQTASILKQQLEEQGAYVILTRPQQNYTSFQMTYDAWLQTHKKKTLDSLLKSKSIDLQRYSHLMKLSKEKFFWSFFRDYELMERAKIINAFKPDITIIIHYNVDEKNTNWLKPTLNNYTMAFIGGAITSDHFSKDINKVHFLRLLLSTQLNESEKLASLTVNQFHEHMGIPIAGKNDADYLKDNCLKAPSKGVFCRNLALCRVINSPLVYGECLYQDNFAECVHLNTADDEVYQQKVPKRIHTAASCYYHAICDYFKQP